MNTTVTITPKAQTINALVKSANVTARLNEVLGTPAKASKFASAVISAVKGNAKLKKADPNSVLSAAMIAATLNLDVVPSLGLAYLVPYGREAQFQIGYKGLIQLMLRTGQISRICAEEVYEGELISSNRFTEEYVFDETARKSNTVIGYMAMFETVNGFRKMTYWPKEKVEEHGKKYSKSFYGGSTPWQTNFDAMAKKTVLKSIIKWAPQSTELAMAQTYDQAVVKAPEGAFDGEEINTDDFTLEYVDNAANGKSNAAKLAEIATATVIEKA